MQVVQKVAHEFMGILLLVAPETNTNICHGGGSTCPAKPTGGKAWGGDTPGAQSLDSGRLLETFHPHMLHVLYTKFLSKKNNCLEIKNIRGNWTCSDLK